MQQKILGYQFTDGQMTAGCEDGLFVIEQSGGRIAVHPDELISLKWLVDGLVAMQEREEATRLALAATQRS